MLEKIIENTSEYIDSMPKTERKKYGQFFTSIETARYMAELFEIPVIQDKISILDAGAGSGILSCAMIDRLEYIDTVKKIEVFCYETDRNVMSLLQKNLNIAKEFSSKEVDFVIKEDNYILSQYLDFNHMIGGNLNPPKYDVVIGNPPYMKIPANSPEANIMKKIVYGQPNLYFLFMAMAAKLTKNNGENIFIVPRSFASGLYFSAFRKWYFKNTNLNNIHIFNSRNNVFKSDKVLQETIIIRSIKTVLNSFDINISVSEDSSNISNSLNFVVRNDLCLNNNILFIPRSEEDVSILKFVQKWTYNLLKNGFKAKTGQVVDFREKELLTDNKNSETIPLLWAYNFEGNKITFPKYVKNKPQFLLNNKLSKRLQMHNENYLLVKRFTAKEERKRIQCALLNKTDFERYEYISAENHLNFISKECGKTTNEELKGLFILFNSNIIDTYFRLFNGSTQVNAGDLNQIPLPSLSDIVNLSIFYSDKSLSSRVCDKILFEHFP